MFSYYGAKTNVVNNYPRPRYGKIIEPFAGSARYSLRYFENDVLLIDKYPVIINIWKWLQQCSPGDIMKLPRRLKANENLNDITFDCQEAKDLMGFVSGCGYESPRMKVQHRKTTDRPNHINYNVQRIAKSLFKIRHWQFLEGDYFDAPDVEATWFIDPPYQFGGQAYVHNKIDFEQLGEWCRNRGGQTIVCESNRATWLDFKPLVQQRGSRKKLTEAIWLNEASDFDNIQQVMF